MSIEVQDTAEVRELEALVTGPPAPPQHVRFSDAIWYKPNAVEFITVGGVGGIGSWLSLMLSRAGYVLVVHDQDTVDQTNMGGQLYPQSAIGKAKTTVISDLCRQFGATQAPYCAGPITEIQEPVALVSFSCFDSMKARKQLFEHWQAVVQNTADGSKKLPTVFIDGRMLAESGQIYVVTPDKAEAYKTQLFDDKEVQEQPCSMKATSHCGAHIASMMVAVFTNYMSNFLTGEDIREVPFKIEFELPLLMHTTKTEKECQTLLDQGTPA
jgi:molybdopterin/thiamine biosynthesis adenylyltransferase